MLRHRGLGETCLNGHNQTSGTRLAGVLRHQLCEPTGIQKPDLAIVECTETLIDELAEDLVHSLAGQAARERQLFLRQREADRQRRWLAQPAAGKRQKPRAESLLRDLDQQVQPVRRVLFSVVGHQLEKRRGELGMVLKAVHHRRMADSDDDA